MASIRDQILDAVVLALNTGRPVGVPEAARKRLIVAEVDSLPLIDVAPGQEVKEPVGGKSGPIVLRKLSFVVRCWTTGDAPEIQADALTNWVTTALEGNRLGGLTTEGLEEVGISWSDEVRDFVYGVAEMEFVAVYVTKRTDQEAKS